MLNINRLKPLCFSAVLLLLQSSMLFAAEPDDRMPSVQDTLREIQRLNQSMFKINQLYISCKMQNECIVVGLKQLAEKDHDAIAKTILEDYQKNEKVDVKSLEYCYQIELTKVNKALEPCVKDSSYQTDKPSEFVYQCLQTSLMPLIQDGSILAQLTLIGYFQQHQKADQVKEMRQKISTIAPKKDNGYLQNCSKAMKSKSSKQE